MEVLTPILRSTFCWAFSPPLRPKRNNWLASFRPSPADRIQNRRQRRTEKMFATGEAVLTVWRVIVFGSCRATCTTPKKCLEWLKYTNKQITDFLWDPTSKDALNIRVQIKMNRTIIIGRDLKNNWWSHHKNQVIFSMGGICGFGRGGGKIFLPDTTEHSFTPQAQQDRPKNKTRRPTGLFCGCKGTFWNLLAATLVQTAF